MSTRDDSRPVRDEDAFDVAAVAGWLRANAPAYGLDGTPEVRQFPGGASNLTYLLTYPDRDLILRRAPRGTVGPSGGALQRPNEDVTGAAIRLGHELASGILPIQGPPGTGKTYTAARMILDLVADGRTVGVTA